MRLENTQSFNRYSYVWNNPLKNSDPSGEIMLTGGYNYTNNTNYNYNQWQYQSAPTIAAPTWQGTDFGAIAGSIQGQLYATGVGVSNYMATQMYSPPSSDAITISLEIIAWGDFDGYVYSTQDVINNLFIDSTYEATLYYLNGEGGTVSLGPNTINTLLTHDSFLYRHERIISGQTTALQGNFSVNLTTDIFHVGRTNVNYSINCSSGNCTATYTLFASDGYWDVDYIDENTLGKLGVKSETADGPGPNLERFGGVPYYYRPVTVKYKFPNPGYK